MHQRHIILPTEIRLEGGPLDVERMKTTLQALVDRHEALRTVINEDGKTQTILPELQVEIPTIDLYRANGVTVEELHQQETEHLFDLQNGPLVRFKIVLLEEKVSLVFIHVHHIICDGWSLGILTRELGEMYGNGLRSTNLQIPKQLSQYATEQADLQQLELYQGK